MDDIVADHNIVADEFTPPTFKTWIDAVDIVVGNVIAIPQTSCNSASTYSHLAVMMYFVAQNPNIVAPWQCFDAKAMVKPDFIMLYQPVGTLRLHYAGLDGRRIFLDNQVLYGDVRCGA